MISKNMLGLFGRAHRLKSRLMGGFFLFRQFDHQNFSSKLFSGMSSGELSGSSSGTVSGSSSVQSS